jgi:hypothetical protein
MDMAERDRIALHGLAGEFRLNEPMRKHTSWRTGGAAQRAYFPCDVHDLAQFVRTMPSDESVYIVGLGSNVLVRDGGLRARLNQSFGKDASIHSLWRFESKDPEDGWRDINVAARGFIRPTAAKIRAACDQGIVHVARTEGAVCAFANIPANVGRDLTCDPELVRLVVPATRCDDVGRSRRVHLCLGESERPILRLPGKDNPGKVGALEEFDQPVDNLLVVIDDVEPDTSTEGDDEDLASWRFVSKLPSRVETGGAKERRRIDREIDRRKTVVGNDDEIGIR